MDPLSRSLIPVPEQHQRQRQGTSLLTLLIVCGIMVMVATAVFRWRVFTAGSKYVIFLLLILFFLIWIGRWTRRK